MTSCEIKLTEKILKLCIDLAKRVIIGLELHLGYIEFKLIEKREILIHNITQHIDDEILLADFDWFMCAFKNFLYDKR